ncbi:MAG: 4-vinyl reductase [Deltaproteobacteria bacterium]|nr:4-vinyl reductase [Deltaproteobacteria bacterium]
MAMDMAIVKEEIKTFLEKEGIVAMRASAMGFYERLLGLSGFGLGGILYMSGKKSGRDGGMELKGLAQKLGISTEDTIREALPVMFTETRWGELNVDSMTENEIIFSLKDSVLARGLKRKKPSCTPIAGALAGIVEVLLDKKADGKEIECVSQGKEKCIFEIKIKQ